MAEKEGLLTREVLEAARQGGADVAGIAAARRLEELAAPRQKPLALLPAAKSVVVYGIALGKGFLRTKESRLKNFAVAQICRELDALGLKLARLLERRGHAVVLMPSNVPTPLSGYYGYLSLRHAAQEAGLGEMGLSQCFLSHRFGPRVYLGAVLTSASLEAGSPAPAGYCAAGKCRQACRKACPAGAIAADGSHDHRKCQSLAQPAGLRSLLGHLRALLAEEDPSRQGELIRSNATYLLWESFISQVGAYGGCFRCLEVCPVGGRKAPSGPQPRLHPSVYLAEGAKISGEVSVGEGCSVWYNAVLRGDEGPITIGRNSHLQDGCVLHSDRGMELQVGDRVLVGHGAVLRSALLENDLMVGMNSTVMAGARIGHHSIVGAHSFIPYDRSFPPYSLIYGAPARLVRKLGEDDLQRISRALAIYEQLVREKLNQ